MAKNQSDRKLRQIERAAAVIKMARAIGPQSIQLREDEYLLLGTLADRNVQGIHFRRQGTGVIPVVEMYGIGRGIINSPVWSGSINGFQDEAHALFAAARVLANHLETGRAFNFNGASFLEVPCLPQIVFPSLGECLEDLDNDITVPDDDESCFEMRLIGTKLLQQDVDRWPILSAHQRMRLQRLADQGY